jgi:hypothetical protein
MTLEFSKLLSVNVLDKKFRVGNHKSQYTQAHHGDFYVP